MLEIDCKELSESAGGQIFRVALSLSSITGIPFKMKNIRIGRKPPGLKPQHLTTLNAVKKITNAEIDGGKLGSMEVTFKPKSIIGGNYEFNIGTAGSITLLAQSIIPILIFSEKESNVRVIGGTHVKWSPTIDYYEKVFLGLIKNFGVKVSIETKNFGFYPKGGGIVDFFVEPSKVKRIEIVERGKLKGIFGICVSSNLREEILEREEKGIKEVFQDAKVEKIRKEGISEGTAVTLWAEYERTIFGSCVVGEKGKRAELVGKECASNLEGEILGEGVLDRYMGDQVLVFLAFGGGKVILNEVTEHVKSCAKTIEIFLNKKFKFDFGKGVLVEF